MKKLLSTIFVVMLLLGIQSKSFAHCEVPCGIYNDELRIAMLYEHFTTLEKAMTQINELSVAEEKNFNQMPPLPLFTKTQWCSIGQGLGNDDG